MAHAYLTHTVPAKLESAADMLQLTIWELKTFGYTDDTNLHDTQRILTEFYGESNSKIMENPTAEMIRDEVSKGNLVIVPAAGRLLQNPYFVQPGPRYHMVMIKGFEGENFIVNEPGTKHGESFRYLAAMLMNAMRDLVTGDITKGPKRVLVVEK